MLCRTPDEIEYGATAIYVTEDGATDYVVTECESFYPESEGHRFIGLQEFPYGW